MAFRSFWCHSGSTRGLDRAGKTAHHVKMKYAAKCMQNYHVPIAVSFDYSMCYTKMTCGSLIFLLLSVQSLGMQHNSAQLKCANVVCFDRCMSMDEAWFPQKARHKRHNTCRCRIQLIARITLQHTSIVFNLIPQMMSDDK